MKYPITTLAIIAILWLACLALMVALIGIKAAIVIASVSVLSMVGALTICGYMR